jgi:hypothetical protein
MSLTVSHLGIRSKNISPHLFSGVWKKNAYPMREMSTSIMLCEQTALVMESMTYTVISSTGVSAMEGNRFLTRELAAVRISRVKMQL